MAQREIPGFYYDAAKGKYFAIQQNHIAPQGSKYSRENVRKEKEQSRKRKRSAALQHKLEAQTVRRSAVLTSPSAAVALWREQGRSRFNDFEARSAFFVSQLQGFESLSLRSCASCGKCDNIYDFVVDQGTDSSILALGSPDIGRIQHWPDSDLEYDMPAFRSDISSLSISASRTLVATALDRCHPGNLYVSRLAEPSDSHGGYPYLDTPAPAYYMLGGPETALWTSKANPPGARDIVAIGSSDSVFMLDAEGRLMQTHQVGEDVRSLDWLSQTVVVGGTKSRPVYLWDARTGGSSQRFFHSSGVTGVRSLGDGSQILVSGFRGAAVYDVRMTAKKRGHDGRGPSAPLLRLAPTVTQYPSQALDVWPEAKIAATSDDDNLIRLHSLSSGRLIGSLTGAGAPTEMGRIKRLRFVHASDGRPKLMACQGSRLFDWSWGGLSDDEG